KCSVEMQHDHIVGIGGERGVGLVLHIVNRGRVDGQIDAPHAVHNGRIRVLIINQRRVEIVLPPGAHRRLVGGDVVWRGGSDKIHRVPGGDQVIDEVVAGAIRGDARRGIAAQRVGDDHVPGCAGMNAGAVVVAGVVGDQVVAAAGNVNARGVVMAGVVGDVGPG